MSRIVIRDLEMKQELNRAAMVNVIGGRGFQVARQGALQGSQSRAREGTPDITAMVYFKIRF